MTARAHERPVVIEARDVEKTFRIPEHRVDSLKERASHPFRRIDVPRAARAAGRLLRRPPGRVLRHRRPQRLGQEHAVKIMSSIYRADARPDPHGRAARAVHRARRRLQPGDHVARERRPQRRDDGPRRGARRSGASTRCSTSPSSREFADLKLKNYSSGMMVRLAFAVMVEADADIMLVDEVLAVGDASFAQKCLDVFHEKRRAGRTLVLVTHDMATVEELCDRAMLIHDGVLLYVGEPGETALRYFRVNFDGRRSPRRRPVRRRLGRQRRRRRRLARGRRGRARANVEQGEPIELRIVLRGARATLDAPVVRHPRASTRWAAPSSASTGALRWTRARRSACRRRASASAGPIENPLRAGPLLRRLLRRAQPAAGRRARSSACGCSTSSSSASTPGPAR